MKKQATRHTDPTVANRVGKGAAVVTVGTLFGLGRFAAKIGVRVGKAAADFSHGVVDASREIKAGYDDAKASK